MLALGPHPTKEPHIEGGGYGGAKQHGRHGGQPRGQNAEELSIPFAFSFRPLVNDITRRVKALKRHEILGVSTNMENKINLSSVAKCPWEVPIVFS